MKLKDVAFILCAALAAGAPAHAQLAAETAFQANKEAIDIITFSSDGGLLATASWDSTVQVHKTDDGSLYHSFYGKSGFHAASISQDGKLVAGGDSDGQIRIWDLSSGAPAPLHAIAAHKGAINALAFSPDGQRLVSAGSDTTVRIWKTDDASPGGLITLHTGAVESVAYSRDGKYMLSSAEDRTVKLFRTDTWELDKDFTVPAAFNMAALSPDNRFIAVACRDKLVRVLDVESDGFVTEFKGHTQPVNAVAYSPSGKYIASAGADAAVRVWNAATGKTVMTLSGATSPVTSVAWSQDGARVAAAATDGMAYVWRPALADAAAPAGQQSSDISKNGRGLKEDAKDSLSRITARLMTTRSLMALLISAALIFMLIATFTDIFSNPDKVFSIPGEPPKSKALPKTPDTTKTPTPIGAIFGNLETISSPHHPKTHHPQSASPEAQAAGGMPELPSFDKKKTNRISDMIMQDAAASGANESAGSPKAPEHAGPAAQDAGAPQTAQEGAGTEAGAPPARAAQKPAQQDKDLVGGKYKVVRELGRGGMAVVYEGLDIQLDKKFALKKMREGASMSEVERDRFLKEARITARLHHPNIVDIYTIIEEGSDIYLVFEYVDGKALDNLLAKYRRIPVKQCVAVSNHVLSALGYAHAQGVVHRDLKPSNIMVASDGFVRVMDFGIAQAARATATKSGIDISGTLAYMSPEQHIGKYDHLTDIFAFGATLYEMVTGQLPFLGPDFLSQKRESAYAKPSEITAVPKPLEDIIIACMQPDKAKRPASAAELQAKIREMKL
jgi:WD40 repeat protein/tRNA A-37 threonylcarbamoyl transferase component Bud32